MRRLLGIAVLVATASGCWLQPGFDGANTRSNPFESRLTASTVSQLRQKWSVTVGGSLSEPIIRGNRIYATRNDPGRFLGVSAYDAGSGGTMWDTSLTNPRNGGATPVTFAGDVLSVAHNPGGCGLYGISRLDPGTGAVLGQDDVLADRPVVSGGGIVASVTTGGCPPFTVPNTLTVKDAVSGAVRWSYTFPAPNYPTYSDDTPTIAAGRVYVANASTLYAFPLDCTSPCTPAWSRTFDGQTLDRAAVAPNGHIHIVTHAGTDGNIDALNPVDGTTYWNIGGADHQVGIEDGRVFMAAQVIMDGPISVLFSAKADRTVPISPATEPFELWGSWLSNDTPTGLVVAGDIVYVTTKPMSGTGDGTLRAFSTAICGTALCSQPLATLTVPGTPTGVSVDNGQVVVASKVNGTTTGTLTAYGLP
jgi:hypothetical protein